MASHSFKETPKKKFGEVRRRKSKKQIIKSITLPELQNNKERNHENECQKNDTKFSANSKPPLRKTLSNNVNGIVSDGCNNNRINANGKTKDLKLQDAVIDVGADIFQSEQIEEESFHTAIRPILTLIQFAGLMPVRGIWDPTPKSLHFQHSSIRTALSVLLLLSFAVLEILAIKYTASVVTSNGSQTLSKVWEATRGTIIYGNAMLSICIFLRLASHWKDLMRQWHNTEEKLKQWPFPRLSKRFIIITAAIIFPSLITHILSTLVYLRINFYPEQKYFCTILLRNEPNSSDTFEKYSVLSNFYIFDGIIDYRVWIALPVNILSRFGILIWVVSDIFIILVSIGLSERFTQFNWRAKDAMSKKMVPADWKSLRNHFNLVTDLVRAVDREVSGLILLSFVRNLCRICLMFSKIVIQRSVNYATMMTRMLLSSTCEEQRSVVRFLWAKGHNPSEIHRDMCGVYGENCMDCNISRWCTFFADDRENLCDSSRSGRPVTAATQHNVTGTEAAIFNDRRIQLRTLSQQFNISHDAVYDIVHDTLKFHEVSARWVPKNLTDDHKGQRMMICLDHLRRYAAEGHDFLKGIVTGDEFLEYQYTPETQQPLWSGNMLFPQGTEIKVIRKIFGAKRDEVTGEWRKLHNAELHALYSSPDIIRNIKSRRLRWAGHVFMGESRNAYRVLVGRPAGKRPLGRPRRRWEDNIKMDLREVGYDGRDWINLAQDRDRWRAYVVAAMNLRVP
ncbi:hypothetical protein ANN_25299 [Periplaneta americana]|uniref:Uncharacterized protein n=1 Tax=Periplaneta americana TaxID=6978 RepID=A0ABQ8S148_PERAM|nr:hypothetical protein ANN_25299 [Periplaneta americana]